MKTWKWNGERWYCDTRSPFKRSRQWLIWIGGWEKPNGGGWRVRLNAWPGGWRRFLPKSIGDSMAPVSLFGHRVTFFGWGLQIKKRGSRILVFSRCGLRKGQPTKIYLSHDGTPSRATTWYRGESTYERKWFEESARAQEAPDA